MQINEKEILVTGGAGMIGSRIVKQLNEMGAIVTVLDNITAYPFDYLNEFGVGQMDGVNFVKGSILDKELLKNLVKDIDYIIHAAAFADVGGCIKYYDIDFNVNVVGTFNLLEVAKNSDIKKFVFVSSASVYGEETVTEEDRRFVENQPCRPISTYGNSKLWGELETKLFYDLYGLPTTAIRYFSVYGQPQVPKMGSHSWCVAIFTMLAMKNKPITVFGDGTQIRDFTYVDDIAKGTIIATETNTTNGKIFNLGTGKTTQVNIIAEKIIETVKKVPIQYKPHPPGDPFGGYADTTLMNKLLDWKPKITLDEGIQRYCEWVNAHKNLIPSWI